MIDVKLSVSLTKPVTGQVIADAVRLLTGQQYRQNMISANDVEKFYRIGRSSMDASREFVIGVGSCASDALSMCETYSEVFILSFSYGGVKLASNCSEEQVIQALSLFRDQLQTALSL